MPAPLSRENSSASCSQVPKFHPALDLFRTPQPLPQPSLLTRALQGRGGVPAVSSKPRSVTLEGEGADLVAAVVIREDYFDASDDYRKMVEEIVAGEEVLGDAAVRRDSIDESVSIREEARFSGDTESVKEEDSVTTSRSGVSAISIGKVSRWRELRPQSQIQLDLFHQITWQDLENSIVNLKNHVAPKSKTAAIVQQQEKEGSNLASVSGSWRTKSSSKKAGAAPVVITGREAVQWFMDNLGEKFALKSRKMAESLGNVLLECGFIRKLKDTGSFTDDARPYQLIGPPACKVLNLFVAKNDLSDSMANGSGIALSENSFMSGSWDPLEIVAKALQRIQSLFQDLHTKGFTSNPTLIPNLFKESYKSFRKCVSRLAKAPLPDSLHRSHEEKLAFFLNLYNTLYLHALIELGVPKQPADGSVGRSRIKLSRKVAYIVDGHRFTLMDIKYGILRARMPLPNLTFKERQFLFPPKFSNSDPRKKLCLEVAESRLAFALCNLTRSSGKLRIYHPDSIHVELQTATRDYIKDHIRLECVGGVRYPVLHARLPKLFEWYRGDFGKTSENVLLWLAEHHWDWIIKSKVADFTYARAFKVLFEPYNWDTDISVALNQGAPAHHSKYNS